MKRQLLEEHESPGVSQHADTLTPAPVAPDGGFIALVERLATDPRVNVETLERLLAMQERVIALRAKAAFDAAFSEMQGELPIIDERGRIEVNGQLRSRFAKHEDIQEAIRPILKQFGFAIRHKDETLPDGKLRIVAILSHREGHREEDEFICPPDGSGSKNDIQAKGSTREYGRRYTTVSILNLTTRGVDDDGRRASEKGTPEPPKGYDEWLTDFTACADNGLAALTAMWNNSKKEYRDFVSRHAKGTVESLKAKAQRVAAS